MFLRKLRARFRRRAGRPEQPTDAEAASQDVGTASDRPVLDAEFTPDLSAVASERVARRRARRRTFSRQPSERAVALRRTVSPAEPKAVRKASRKDSRPAVFAGRQPTRVTLTHGGTRRRVPTDVVERSEPGVAWWRYRRQRLRRRDDGASGQTPASDAASGQTPATDVPASPAAATEPPSTRGAGLETAAATDRSGLVPGVLAAMCFAIVAATSRMEVAAVGRVLIPAGAILAAIAIGHVLTRRHPDEPWLPRLLVAGVVVKIAASMLRFYALVGEYGNHGDASVYDLWGRKLFDAWVSGGPVPNAYSGGSAGTGFVRRFTGVVYYAFGPDMVNGFLIFGLLALIGSYLWYRAAVEAVPFLNKRLYFLLVFFVPSIAFWPSSIGKEALMQLGLGAVALGTARLLKQRLFQGILIALPGGWLLWRVRPHLLAFATFAAGAAYVIGRVRRGRTRSESTSLFKPVGMVIVALLAFFALNQAAEFLGMEDFSISSIERELNEQTGRTSQGGSQVETGKVSLTPLSVPQGAVKVLLRPFPWEVETSLQILASLESVALAGFIIYRIRSVVFSLTRARTTPFFIYCWTLVLLYAVAFSAVANYGLLTRQRSLALPALFALLAVEPAMARVGNTEDRSKSPPRPIDRVAG